jgi:hypothetical protein
VTPAKPHRVGVGEIALALAQKAKSDPVCTVSLTLNAAGHTQITVDVDDTDIAAAGKKAEREFNRLCRLYPRPKATK